MKPNKDLPFTQWTVVFQSEKFISVEPLSGYRLHVREDEDYKIYLQPDATEEALGRALLEALDKSRFFDPRKEREFFNADRIVKVTERWNRDFMTRYGYKTKREAYKNMLCCKAKRSEGKISITPYRRDKPEYWGSLPPEKTVVIPATTDPAIAGAALRLALSRCE